MKIRIFDKYHIFCDGDIIPDITLEIGNSDFSFNNGSYSDFSNTIFFTNNFT